MPVAAHKIDWRHLKAISHGHFPAPIMEGIPSVFTRISIHALRHSARHRSWVSREAPRDSWPSWRSGGQDGFCIGIPSGTSRFQHVILQWRISPGIGTLDPNYFEMLVSMQDIWLYLHFRPVNWHSLSHTGKRRGRVSTLSVFSEKVQETEAPEEAPKESEEQPKEEAQTPEMFVEQSLSQGCI